MNILYHHRTQGKGVEGVHIRSVVKALTDLNHHVTVISPPGCNPMQEEKTKSENSPKLINTIFSFLSRNCPEFLFEFLEVAYNISAFFKISKQLKNKKIDLIYERYFLFSIASILISKKYNIPIIYEVNDSSFVPRLRQLKLVKIANYIERMVFSRADALITVSNYFKNCLVEAGIPEEKIDVSHNAVDPNLFSPGKTKELNIKIPRDRLILGFVGLFVKWVGLEDLVHLYHQIHSQHPETHLLLVGGGPQESHVRKIVSDFQLQLHVTITGKVPHREIPSYIKVMDICIIPKHEKYTSPVKLFEYMAMGKAVLVPAYESLGEVIEHGKNGMLFDPNNDHHFLSLLKQMVKNKELLKSLAENARRDVLRNYTWRKNALQIEKWLQRIRHRRSSHTV